MNDTQIATAAIVVTAALGLLSILVLNAILFKKLRDEYPHYYKTIGEPKAFGYVGVMPKPGDYSKRIKGGLLVLSLAFKGAPENFPADIKLRKLTKIINYAVKAVIVTLIVFMVVLILH